MKHKRTEQESSGFSFNGHSAATSIFANDNFTEYCDKFPDKVRCEVINVTIL